MARVSEFRYGSFISQVMRKENGQKLKYLNNFGTGKSESFLCRNLIELFRLGNDS